MSGIWFPSGQFHSFGFMILGERTRFSWLGSDPRSPVGGTALLLLISPSLRASPKDHPDSGWCTAVVGTVLRCPVRHSCQAHWKGSQEGRILRRVLRCWREYSFLSALTCWPSLSGSSPHLLGCTCTTRSKELCRLRGLDCGYQCCIRKLGIRRAALLILRAVICGNKVSTFLKAIFLWVNWSFL